MSREARSVLIAITGLVAGFLLGWFVLRPAIIAANDTGVAVRSAYASGRFSTAQEEPGYMTSLIVDDQTGVQYLVVTSDSGIAVCPLYNYDGTVAIEGYDG